MLNYFKGLASILTRGEDNSEEELSEEESKVINAIKSLNLKTDKSSDSESEEETPLGESDPVIIPVHVLKCTHKTGKITHLSEEYGLIDNVIYFVPNQVSSSITVRQNDEVFYTAYKAKDNESERVYKIYALKKDLLEDDTVSSDLDKNSRETDYEVKGIVRHIPGRVTERRGRDMYIDSIESWCSLDKIEISFIPIEGDWVSAQVIVEVEENVENFAGNIIEITSIKPLIKKSGFGRVSLWSLIQKEGAIENSVFFTALECESGYSPNLGDQVVYDAIESDQGSLKWRALIVYPWDKNSSEEDRKNCNTHSDEMFVPENSKNEVTITPSVCGVEIELHKEKKISFTITNNSSQKKCLKKITLTSKRKSQISVVEKPKPYFLLTPKQTIDVNMICRGNFLGLNGETCIFRFEDFIVSRNIEINVTSSKDMDEILKRKEDRLVNDFKRKKIVPRKPNTSLFGPKPWNPPKFISRERKFIFRIPKKLQDLIYKNSSEKAKIKALEEYAPCLKFDLNFKHYAHRNHTLLFLEELEIRINFTKYDMDDVFLSQSGDYFSLEVPGLVERRPSIIIGDSIILTQPWSEVNKIEHVGFIFEILKDEVLVKFHNSFHKYYDGSKCNVRFLPNTFFFARCHEAVRRAEKVLGEEWLFPAFVNEKPPQIDFSLINYIENISSIQNPFECEKSDKSDKVIVKKHKKKVSFKWMNKNLNERQKLAVLNVLKGQGRPLPYIILGPPGTGKTVTLVEIILQVYSLIPDSRILVTTPSNSAADLICFRLIEMVNIEPGQLIRLAAITRVLEGLVPVQLRPYTTFYRNSEYRASTPKGIENLRQCSINELTGKHRITVSTCTNIGRLHFSGFSTGHFTHILIDEAGQTVEPEVLISATFQNTKTGQVVLAGDPHQLGPVVCSKLAKFYGFGESLLERFSKTFPYAKDIKSFPETSGFDPRFIIRLNVNYRSVPEILTLFSKMFYNSDLIPTVSPTDSEEASIIKKFNFMGEGRDKPAAIIFHGIIGTNHQESDSPSWFNPQEIWQVVLYLKKLYSIGLKCSDIGIVTPYSKQVFKLKHVLNSLNLALPKIGAVEEHQGQENKVIILSTVRSSLKHVQSDIAHHLGFVACPKRLNVSLTRARALLIIIGNPVLLSHDPYWVTVIRYCIDNKSYTGCNLKYFKSKLGSELREYEKKEEEAQTEEKKEDEKVEEEIQKEEEKEDEKKEEEAQTEEKTEDEKVEEEIQKEEEKEDEKEEEETQTEKKTEDEKVEEEEEVKNEKT